MQQNKKLVLPAMMSSFGQPEFTVTVIAVWCHMVWNPASHLEGTKEKSRSMSKEEKNNTAIWKVAQRKMTRMDFMIGHYLPTRMVFICRESSGHSTLFISEKQSTGLHEVPTLHLPTCTYLSLLLINGFPACFWKTVFTVIRAKVFRVTAIWLL